jgi:hypothetical protein
MEFPIHLKLISFQIQLIDGADIDCSNDDIDNGADIDRSINVVIYIFLF